MLFQPKKIKAPNFPNEQLLLINCIKCLKHSIRNALRIIEREVNQLVKVQNFLIKLFTKYSKPIQTNHASKINFLLSKLLINQHAKIKHMKSTHNTVIYMETQFGKNHQ